MNSDVTPGAVKVLTNVSSIETVIASVTVAVAVGVTVLNMVVKPDCADELSEGAHKSKSKKPKARTSTSSAKKRKRDADGDEDAEGEQEEPVDGNGRGQSVMSTRSARGRKQVCSSGSRQDLTSLPVLT